MTPYNKICMIGLGYIGLPTAALIASKGIEVVGVDINKKVVETVNKGDVHIVEPDLDGLVHKVVTNGKLRATNKPEKADAFMISVPTPFEHKTKKPDMTYVEQAAKEIAPFLEKGNLVVLESTSPPGSTERICKLLSELRPDLNFPQKYGTSSDIFLAYCPERVLPGRILTELVHNARVIGGLTPACSERASVLYQSFTQAECVQTDSGSAEMVKLTENAFRDTNIAFANELSMICDTLGFDVWEVIRIANLHPRVDILQPGAGVGGHCIAVDPWFIADAAPEDSNLIQTSRQVNDSKPDWVIKKVLEAASTMERPVITCLGLAFKPDVDDLRESPAIKIVKKLAKENVGKLIAVDPYVEELPASLADNNVEFMDAHTGVELANIIVTLTRHKQFQLMNMNRFRHKVIIDACGLLAPQPFTIQLVAAA